MKTKVLITGANGFIGSNLLNYLENKNFELYAWFHSQTSNKESFKINLVDIRNEEDVLESYSKILPDIIIHLAAFTSPMNSWNNPISCFNINLLGTINLLQAIIKNSYKPAKLLFIGTSGVYNEEIKHCLIKEQSIQNPMDPYALSKFISEKYITLCKKKHDLQTLIIRPFSIIGAGKKNDFCSDIAKQIVQIENGVKSKLEVGNLEIERDFLDVRDAVKAIFLLMTKDTPYEEYNICSGKGIKLSKMIDIFSKISTKDIKVIINKKFIRNNDIKFRVGSNDRLAQIGWKSQYPISETVEEILNFWRNSTK